MDHHHDGTANVNKEILESQICPVESRITIAEQLSHPIALRTEKILALSTEDHTQRILPKRGAFLHVYVSREQMARKTSLESGSMSVGGERRECHTAGPYTTFGLADGIP